MDEADGYTQDLLALVNIMKEMPQEQGNQNWTHRVTELWVESLGDTMNMVQNTTRQLQEMQERADLLLNDFHEMRRQALGRWYDQAQKKVPLPILDCLFGTEQEFKQRVEEGMTNSNRNQAYAMTHSTVNELLVASRLGESLETAANTAYAVLAMGDAIKEEESPLVKNTKINNYTLMEIAPSLRAARSLPPQTRVEEGEVLADRATKPPKRNGPEA